MEQNDLTKTNGLGEEIFDPINSAAPKERSYTNPFAPNPGELETPIPEPSYSQANNPSLENTSTANSDTDKKSESKNEPSFNDSFSELDEGDKKEGAKLMAEAILDGYSSLKGYAAKITSISESKLDMEISSGEINPSISVYEDNQGNPVNVRAFVKEYNSELSEAFFVSQEFKDKVTPPLVRVLKKKGVAMTDEQLLMYYFGKDVVETGITAVQIVQQNKQILQSLRDQTSALAQYATPVVKKEENSEITRPTNPENVEEKTPIEVVKPSPENTIEDAPVKNNDLEVPVQKFDGPTFGDPDLMKHMEEVAKAGGASKKNSTNKKETAKPATSPKKRGRTPKNNNNPKNEE